MIICHVKLTSWIEREMDGSEVRFQQTHESVTVVPLGNSLWLEQFLFNWSQTNQLSKQQADERGKIDWLISV